MKLLAMWREAAWEKSDIKGGGVEIEDKNEDCKGGEVPMCKSRVNRI